jgi:hypothetical protein
VVPRGGITLYPRLRHRRPGRTDGDAGVFQNAGAVQEIVDSVSMATMTFPVSNQTGRWPRAPIRRVESHRQHLVGHAKNTTEGATVWRPPDRP